MPPTDQLKEEHQGILLMLKILEKVCDKIESRGRVDLDHLERIVEFIKIFVDQCHHGKEEDLLFPAIIPMEGKLIGILLGEHSEGRSYVRAMGYGLTQMKKVGGDAGAEYAANAQKYIALMTQHIQKENNVLFPCSIAFSERKSRENWWTALRIWSARKLGREPTKNFSSFSLN
jgi:hemerythrin-like domain-containing protein